jgi:hypothetical protein
MTLHPKTSAAAVGGALGVVIVSVLGSIHGIHLSPEANAAIPTFLSTLGSWLTPSGDVPVPVVVPRPPPVPVAEPVTVAPVAPETPVA